MMEKNLYLDFHIIQTVPPSCVNRDDMGSPKTAFYGGAMRARVSSQAWKKAMREAFEDLLDKDMLGKRTREIGEFIAEKMRQVRPELDEETAKATADSLLELAGVSSEGKKKALFLVSNPQVKAAADVALAYMDDAAEAKDKKKTYIKAMEKALQEAPSADILLFGRMAAGNHSLEYDAAAQVAHAISTHVVTNEFDYFTAMDELDKEESSGAGHLGVMEFNSSTLYRYANVNIRELSENLGEEEIIQILMGFTAAFICSMPGGKMASFANKTLPDMIYVALREDQPVNLVGAFEMPVRAKRKNEEGEEEYCGYVRESEKQLANYAKELYGIYDALPSDSWIVSGNDMGLAKKVNYKELFGFIEKAVRNRMS